jgi:tape measure domain-containing protein
MPEISSITTRIAVDTSRLERDLQTANRKIEQAAQQQRQIGRTTADLISRSMDASTQRISRVYDRLTASIERDAARQAAAVEREQARATAAWLREADRQEAVMRRVTAAAEREAGRQAAASRRFLLGMGGSALRGLGGGAVALGGGVLGGAANLASGAITTATSALENLARAGLTATAVLGGLATAGFVAVARAGVDMNETLERATQTLSRITGSGAAGRGLVAQIKQESLTSAATFKDLVQIGTQLAVAYGPNGLGKVLPTMRAFGDTAVALNVDTEGLQRALLGFRQLLERRTPQQEELNQISENLPGVGLSGILRRAFGTSDTQELQKMQVTGKQVGDAIVKGMAAAFGGTQLRASGSIQVLQSNIADALTNISANVTSGFTRNLKAALQNVMGFLQELERSPQLLAPLKAIFDRVGEAIEVVSGKLPQLVEGLGRAFEMVRAEWAKLWPGLTGPLEVGVRVIGGSIAGIINVFREMIEVNKSGQTGFQETSIAMVDFAKDSIRALKELISSVFLAVAAYGALMGAVGAATRNPRMVVEGAGKVAIGMGGAFGAQTMGARMGRSLDDLRTQILSREPPSQIKEPGPTGAFFRGFFGFQQFADRMYGGLGQMWKAFGAGPAQRQANEPMAAPPSPTPYNQIPAGMAPPPGGYRGGQQNIGTVNIHVGSLFPAGRGAIVDVSSSIWTRNRRQELYDRIDEELDRQAQRANPAPYGY